MKTIRRPIGLLAVLAAALALLFWFDPAPQDGAPGAAAPRNAAAATPSQAAPPQVAPPQVAAAQPRNPVRARRPVVSAPPVANPPLDLAPPVAAASGDAQNPAEIGAQVSSAAEPQGDSVLGWGPWTGSGSAENAGGPAAQDGVPRVEGLSRTLSGAPPGGPPPVDSPINSGHGHGHGHTNHGHGHRP